MIALTIILCLIIIFQLILQLGIKTDKRDRSLIKKDNKQLTRLKKDFRTLGLGVSR